MALPFYFDGKRGYPGYLVTLTGSSGTGSYRTVIPSVSIVDASGNPTGGGSSSTPTYVASVGGAPTSGVNTTIGTTAKAITNGATVNGPAVYTQGVEITVVAATGTCYVGGSGLTAANGVPHVQGDRFTFSGDPATVFMLASTGTITIAFWGN